MGDFDRLPQAHSEVVADAIVEILKADEGLHDVTGGRIFRIPDLFANPDRTLPSIVVSSLSEARVNVPTQETEQLLRIGIGIAYNETRSSIEPGDRSVSACVQVIHSALAANQNLEQTRAGGENALVDRFVELTDVQYDAAQFDDQGSASGFLPMQAVYGYLADTLTGVFAGA